MLLALAAIIAADPSVEGRWKNPSGRVVVLIEACGAALCGSVVSAADSAKADARRGGTTNLVGTQLMSGFKPAGPGKWRGRMFVPDINHRSKAELQLVGTNQLKVTGCMVARMICKSQLWSRAD
ncbi:MAG: DUF2147 domain-containing protein [Sphingomicrobium sp.]